MNNTIYTIGHSTQPIDEFINILQAYEIGLVVDVRTIPRSRHNPQFNEDELKETLGKKNIAYIRLEKLGGLRHTTKASIKTGADLAVRRIELRELLRADNPDRDAATKKVQEISNLRGELIKLRVEAMIAAKKVLTPEQQKKIRAFREMRREEARRRRGMMGMIERMGRQPGPAPTPPPGPGSVPKPPAQ